jgi:hypothetical protein
MGAEANCQLRVNGATYEGKALLETDELLFRGSGRSVRLEIPLATIRNVTAASGELRVQHIGGDAAFVLGAQAEKWAERIRNPRSLLDKLDVKPGQTISVVGLSDEEFIVQLRERVGRVVKGKLTRDSDLVFLGAKSESDLARIPAALEAMTRHGAIWVVHPKGKNGLPDTAIFAAAKRAGLTYTKVARFSATHTAEKLVLPKAKR